MRLGRQAPPFRDYRQVWTRRAAMARTPRRLAARARRFRLARLRLRDRGALLASLAVEPLFESAEARLRQFQFLFECGLTRHGPLGLALPVAGILFQLDVLLLGQGDHNLGKGRPVLPKGRSRSRGTDGR